MFPVIKKNVKKFLLEEHGKITKKSVIAMGLYAALMSTPAEGVTGSIWPTFNNNYATAVGYTIDDASNIFPTGTDIGYNVIYANPSGAAGVFTDETSYPGVLDISGSPYPDNGRYDIRNSPSCPATTIPDGWTISIDSDSYYCDYAGHVSHIGDKKASSQIRATVDVETDVFKMNREIACPVVTVIEQPREAWCSIDLKADAGCNVEVNAGTHTNSISIKEGDSEVITASHGHNIDAQSANICLGYFYSQAVPDGDIYKPCIYENHCDWCC